MPGAVERDGSAGEVGDAWTLFVERCSYLSPLSLKPPVSGVLALALPFFPGSSLRVRIVQSTTAGVP